MVSKILQRIWLRLSLDILTLYPLLGGIEDSPEDVTRCKSLSSIDDYYFAIPWQDHSDSRQQLYHEYVCKVVKRASYETKNALLSDFLYTSLMTSSSDDCQLIEQKGGSVIDYILSQEKSR